MPDLSTLRLCSMLASVVFASMFLALWRGKSGAAYLLHWAAGSASYAGVLVAFELCGGPPGPVIGPFLLALLAGSSLLTLSGVRLFEGLPAFRWWMVAPSLACALANGIPQWIAAVGVAVPLPFASRLGETLALACCTAAVGSLLLVGRYRRASRGRVIAGVAQLGYLPGYLLALATELSGAELNGLALLAMMSDQVLLTMLNLGLLAMPGERAQQELRDCAWIDGLTGTRNRAWLVAAAGRIALPGTAVVLIDIDHFKRVNDRHGHLAGDAVLANFAQRAQHMAAVRSGHVVRIGGDEFVAILPTTPPYEAAHFAEALRAAVALPSPGICLYTISLGVAAVEPGDAGIAAAMARADAALYDAKAQGRDRVAA